MALDVTNKIYTSDVLEIQQNKMSDHELHGITKNFIIGWYPRNNLHPFEFYSLTTKDMFINLSSFF